jgi:hypothetical protein
MSHDPIITEIYGSWLLDSRKLWKGMVRVRTADYLAFLLRLWREGQSAPWRAMLVDPSTGERRGFADLTKLFAFLQEQTGETAPEVKPAADPIGRGGDRRG